MAEGFELYHVPQQSRRDKLRVSAAAAPPHNSLLLSAHNHNNNDLHHHAGAGGCVGSLPLYDPSLDLLTCAGHGSHLLACPQPNTIKGETPNFMGFQTTQNPNSNCQFLYPAQTRDFDHSSSSSSAGELALYRPEPLLSRQGLSLSLSSNTHLPMELNFQYAAPPGPFTGYTSVLKSSVFLRPAQLLLQEACDVAGFCPGEKMEPDLSLLDPPSGLDDMGLSDCGMATAQADNQRKSRLISMLDEVYRRYRQYYQQMQAVVASFESIPGLNNAAPFANFALKSLSKHFKCLKAAIIDQLQFISKSPGALAGQKHRQSDENDKFALYGHRPIHNASRVLDNQPVWRPQRGLPERAVSVLRSWLFEHFLHPYPTDTDKMMLAKQTGLTRSQVSNWFINARVRLWKPMVEEIHALETRQQAHHSASASSQTNKDHFVASSSSLTPDKTRPSLFPPEKRVRNELSDLPLAVHHQYGQFGAGGYPNPPGGSTGVSLTLALHQNSNGINGLLGPFPPVGLAQRYGLPANVDVAGGGFEGQSRHFSSRDVMGGQLLHDFVG